MFATLHYIFFSTYCLFSPCSVISGTLHNLRDNWSLSFNSLLAQISLWNLVIFWSDKWAHCCFYRTLPPVFPAVISWPWATWFQAASLRHHTVRAFHFSCHCWLEWRRAEEKVRWRSEALKGDLLAISWRSVVRVWTICTAKMACIFQLNVSLPVWKTPTWY